MITLLLVACAHVPAPETGEPACHVDTGVVEELPGPAAGTSWTGTEGEDSLGSGLAILRGGRLVIGASGQDVDGSGLVGSVYVFPTNLEGEQSPTAADLVIRGERLGDWTGESLADAGDVNGDGESDLLVGAPRLSGDDGVASRVGLFLSPFAGERRIDDADRLWLEPGDVSYFGNDVAGLVNAPDGPLAAVAWVLDEEYGDTTGSVFLFDPALPGGAADTAAVAWLKPEWAYGAFGYSLARAGDLNGDGVDELVVGAQYTSVTSALEGAAYVFSGDVRGVVGAADAGFEIAGTEETGQVGWYVDGQADADGDGLDDLLVVGATWGPGTNPYAVAAVYPGWGDRSAEDTWLRLENHGQGAFPWMNQAVLVPDVDGDGRAEIAAGDHMVSVAEGVVGEVVWFPSNGPGTYDWCDAPLALHPTRGVSMLGAYLAQGDATGDGVADLLVGSHEEVVGGVNVGAAYLLDGRVLAGVGGGAAQRP